LSEGESGEPGDRPRKSGGAPWRAARVFSDDGGHFYAGGGLKVVIGW